MEAIYKARTHRTGKLIYASPDDIEGYCIQYPDMDVTVHIKPIVKDSEKVRLYAYYHKVILPNTVMALTSEGWEGITEAFADKYLKNAIMKKVVYNRITGEEDFELPDKSSMTKEVLTRLVSGSVLLLENRHSWPVPDSQSYLENKRTGSLRNFKKIR